jgi:hypothetical protein
MAAVSEVELRWMSAASAAAAAEIAPWASDGLIARDRGATYWHVASGGRWSAFRDGRWISEVVPTTLVEVPAGVPDTSPAPSERPAYGMNSAVGLDGLAAAIERIRATHEHGVITSGDAEDAAARLHVIDVEGGAWTRGCRSGAWYRWSGGRWVERPAAPDPGALLTAAEFIMACPACGAAAEGRRFCGDCGAEQPASRVTPEVGAALGAFLENGYGTIPEPVTASWDPPAAPTAPVPLAAPPAAPAAPVGPEPVVSPPPLPPARRVGGIRRLASTLSTVLGVALLALSLGRIVLAAAGPTSSPPPATLAPSEAPSAGPVALASDGPSAPPSNPEPIPSPSDSASVWFADSFETPAAWFVGEQEFLTARYDAGRYIIEPRPVDLPVYLWAASDGSAGPSAIVEATVRLPALPSTEAGLVVEDIDGMTRFLFMAAADGRWYLFIDDPESFRTEELGYSDALMAGRDTRLRLTIDPNGVEMSADGTVLGSADVTLDLAGFGVAVRALQDGSWIEVDDYTVTVPGA